MSLKEKLFEQWKEVEPAKRTRAVQVMVVAVLICAALIMYVATDQGSKLPKEIPKVSLVSVGENRLQDDLRSQFQKERQVSELHQEQTDKQVSEHARQVRDLEDRQKALDLQIEALTKAAAGGDTPGGSPIWPEHWPSGRSAVPLSSLPTAEPLSVPSPEPEFVGDIASQQAPAAPDDAKKKDDHTRFYLPVSYMGAWLLTGLKAKTIETARNDPEPMLLRVQAPAVLPNEVRAQLKGCFIVANGFGSLASERIEARLVTLSCLNYADQSVIETSIKGIVVDKDGFKGLAGHVVSKAGANAARAIVAGTFAGVGQALSQSSTTQSTSPLGSTSTIRPGEVGSAALGQGLASGANEMSKVYLDLVRQSAPVVEHGPDTDCTVFLTEGVWLEVKDIETGSRSEIARD